MKLNLEDFDIVARHMMELIAHDNGCVNRCEPMKYPAKHLKAIRESVSNMVAHNADIITDAFLEDMCIGGLEERTEKYSKLEGYSKLDSSLNAYFDSL